MVSANIDWWWWWCKDMWCSWSAAGLQHQSFYLHTSKTHFSPCRLINIQLGKLSKTKVWLLFISSCDELVVDYHWFKTHWSSECARLPLYDCAYSCYSWQRECGQCPCVTSIKTKSRHTFEKPPVFFFFFCSCSKVSCGHKKTVAVKNHNCVPSSSTALLVVRGNCVLPRLLVGERSLHWSLTGFHGFNCDDGAARPQPPILNGGDFPLAEAHCLS